MDLFLLPSPERVLDGDVAVHSDGQKAEDGALGEHEHEAGDEQAAVEVCTEAGAASKYHRFRNMAQISPRVLVWNLML